VVVGTQSVTSFDRMLFKGLALNTTPHTRDRKGIAINNAIDAFDQSQPSHFVHGTGIDEKIIYNIFNFHCFLCVIRGDTSDSDPNYSSFELFIDKHTFLFAVRMSHQMIN
jgi:hypothetical protein